MKILKLVAASTLLIGSLTACGGGGGSTAITSPPGPTASTVLTGIASKGPFLQNSTVNVYAVTNGAKGELITTTRITDDNGSYRADLGSYTGPVLLEVSGSYLDEATGHSVLVADTAPIRAALPLAQGSVTLPVTPLTELAVQKAASLASDDITAANALISSVFKVDIIATLPVSPTSAAMAGASQAQKDYTLALAAVSQLASGESGTDDGDKLKNALSSLSQGITATGMSSAVATGFQGALQNFVSGNPNNHTGVSDTSATSLVNAGSISQSYTLTLQGNIPSGANGIQFDLVLPAAAGMNVNSNDSTVLASSLAPSSGLPTDLLVATRYSSGTLTVGMITVQGVAPGILAKFTCNIASGSTAPPASAISVQNLKVVDAKGNALPGVSLTVN
jgi:hypothetical protein